MSVVFSVAQEPTGYALGCGCGRSAEVSFSTYADAIAAHGAFVFTCGDDYCTVYPASVRASFAFEGEVQLSNVNARHILATLGVDAEELYGTLTGEEFLGRVLVAEALSVGDPGVPAIAEGNFVDCGRFEGYTDMRIAELREIAQFAADRKMDVHWG